MRNNRNQGIGFFREHARFLRFTPAVYLNQYRHLLAGLGAPFIDFQGDFQRIDRLYHVENGYGLFNFIILEMPDKMPFNFITDYLVGILRFLDIILPDDFYTGSHGFHDFPGLSRLGGCHQFDTIG
jgi:hypothetical protein